MKPLSLKLIGFKGLRAGVGLEEIFIDFTKLPEGLVAICGGNGMGKTTIMDNMHPFRIMPYKLRKAKTWSPAAFSYYDHCYGSDAVKEFIFDMGGKRYKTLILIDADKRKQEAYLYIEEGGQWKPLNDGKTNTYDTSVEEVVGSPTLFFTSVFRAQGAKNLSEYSRGDIMGMIAELLNIDHIKEQGDNARKVVEALKTAADIELNKLTALNSEISESPAIEKAISEAESYIESETKALSEKKSDLEAITANISDAEKRQAVQETERARLSEMESSQSLDRQEINSIFGEIKAKEDRVRVEKDSHYDAYEKTKGEVARERTALTKEKEGLTASFSKAKTDLGKNLERAEKITSNADKIRAKVTEEEAAKVKLEGLKLHLSEKETEKQWLEIQYNQRVQLRQNISSKETELANAIARHNLAVHTIETAIKQAEKTASMLEGIDCWGDGSVNEGCRFIADAVSAKNSLGKLREELAAKQQPEPVIETLKSEISQLTEEANTLADVPKLLTDCNLDITTVKREIAEIEASLIKIAEWTKLLPELDQAEKNITQWRAELSQKEEEYTRSITWIDEKIQGLDEKLEASFQELNRKTAALDNQLSAELAGLREKRFTIEKRLSEREETIKNLRETVGSDYATAIKGYREEIEKVKGKITAIETNIIYLQTQLGGFKAKLEALAAKQVEVACIKDKIDRFNQEISYWVLLAKACSNEGIIALEIDDSGPSIAGLTNDLLSACYGPRFTVRLETQSIKKDGGVKEDFDITVFDSETDEEKSITNLSGGQITWIEDAITRAICLYNIHRSDKSFGTLFSDEKDGALDDGRKTEFFRVKRRAMEIGHHTREFFISQTPELVEMANARILLEKGRVTVQ